MSSRESFIRAGIKSIKNLLYCRLQKWWQLILLWEIMRVPLKAESVMALRIFSLPREVLQRKDLRNPILIYIRTIHRHFTIAANQHFIQINSPPVAQYAIQHSDRPVPLCSTLSIFRDWLQKIHLAVAINPQTTAFQTRRES